VSVIDALDESGDPETRQGLLSVLGNEAAEQPSNLRVPITPHAEKDIQDALPAKKHVRSRSLKNIDPNPADATARFVEAQLRHIAALKCKWPDNCWCRLLLEKSEGHFQWVFTIHHLSVLHSRAHSTRLLVVVDGLQCTMLADLTRTLTSRSGSFTKLRSVVNLWRRSPRTTDLYLHVRTFPLGI
jgi:hypothetical protein